ncbi:MAG: hydroxymethylbilane synthase [Candidatus Eremiobacteraeota bacterium]|nr:hydroxymethylbilane synthase [Candidatus Eremiobacteraeota bacterium]MCW5867725.1 hydroxymethylbilane synthase [Candidatus Eremiobacteraeota bacterium]
MKHLKLGTRGSALALTQSQGVADQLMARVDGLKVELVVIKTTGDLNQRDPLASFGGKGVFVKELEQALLEGQVDFAVHSLKDMPSQLPAGLHLTAPPPRADARDALVGSAPLGELAAGVTVGTGSLRRQMQLRALRPDLEYRDVRGNVPTRVEKWRSGEYPGGVVLACAGLQRLGEQCGAGAAEIHPLSPQECLPSPCQGILGLECARAEVAEVLSVLADPEASVMMAAERAYLAALGGDCNLPAGGYATVQDGRLTFEAVLWRDGELKRARSAGDLDAGAELGRQAAVQLLS